MPDSEELRPLIPYGLGNIISRVPLSKTLSITIIPAMWKSDKSYYYYCDIITDLFNILEGMLEFTYTSSMRNFLIFFDRNNSKGETGLLSSHSIIRFICNRKTSFIAPSEPVKLEIKFLINTVNLAAIKGQKAVGQNNDKCLLLAIKKNNLKKYITRVAYVDGDGNINYISRRLIERVVSSLDYISSLISNTPGIGASTSTISYTTLDINIENVKTVWMGFIPFESGEAWGSRGGVFDTGGDYRAFGMFNFDITDAGGNGKGDLVPFILATLAKGYPYFKELASFSSFNGDSALTRNFVARVFKAAESVAAEEHILEMAWMLTNIAANKYLKNVMKYASEESLDITRYQGREQSAIIGALWSFSNRVGAGNVLRKHIRAMVAALKRGGSFVDVINAGYDYALNYHTNPDEKPRWSNQQNYNSERYALFNFVNGTASQKYNVEIDLENLVVITISSSELSYSYILNCPIILATDFGLDSTLLQELLSLISNAHDFGFYGDKSFDINLNLFSTADFSSGDYKANIISNIMTEEVLPLDFDSYNSNPGYLLYIDVDSKIYFRISNGKYTYNIDTTLKLPKSESSSNHIRFNIEIKKLYKNLKYNFIIYQDGKLVTKSTDIYFDNSFILLPDSSRSLIIGGCYKKNSEGKFEYSADASNLSFYDRLYFCGVSPRNDIVNVFLKDLGLGFYQSLNILSDI